ncbi:MAG: ATP-grasp domain-containing protein, partial [Actinomycetota bacterium]|nr:ATP-grasp domain-containing protein [Actinomycetota bacterium]
MRDLLILCPQARDIVCIEAADVAGRYRVRYVGSDLDQLDDFDPASFLEECEAIPADGVVGTKDQSALLASILAERRGFSGPTPLALLACQHKPTSRGIQQRAVPDATPRFAVLDGELPFEVPFFVKPVVGRLSQNAFRIDDAADLVDLQEIDRYTARHGEIAALAGASPDLAHGFLVEELLTGLEVTLEGYVHEGRVTTIGVTDSVKYPGTLSFERFEYPTTISEEREAELSDTAAVVLSAVGFDGGF